MLIKRFFAKNHLTLAIFKSKLNPNIFQKGDFMKKFLSFCLLGTALAGGIFVKSGMVFGASQLPNGLTRGSTSQRGVQSVTEIKDASGTVIARELTASSYGRGGDYSSTTYELTNAGEKLGWSGGSSLTANTNTTVVTSSQNPSVISQVTPTTASTGSSSSVNIMSEGGTLGVVDGSDYYIYNPQNNTLASSGAWSGNQGTSNFTDLAGETYTYNSATDTFVNNGNSYSYQYNQSTGQNVFTKLDPNAGTQTNMEYLSAGYGAGNQFDTLDAKVQRESFLRFDNSDSVPAGSAVTSASIPEGTDITIDGNGVLASRGNASAYVGNDGTYNGYNPDTGKYASSGTWSDKNGRLTFTDDFGETYTQDPTTKLFTASNGKTYSYQTSQTGGRNIFTEVDPNSSLNVGNVSQVVPTSQIPKQTYSWDTPTSDPTLTSWDVNGVSPTTNVKGGFDDGRWSLFGSRTSASQVYQKGDWVPGADVGHAGQTGTVVAVDDNTVTLGYSDGSTTVFQTGQSGRIIQATGRNSYFNSDGTFHQDGVDSIVGKVPDNFSVNYDPSASRLATNSYGLKTITGQGADGKTYVFQEVKEGSYIQVKDTYTVAGNSFQRTPDGIDWKTTTFNDGHQIAVGSQNVGGIQQTVVQRYDSMGTRLSTTTLSEANGQQYLTYKTGNETYIIKQGEALPDGLSTADLKASGYDIQVDGNGNVAGFKAQGDTQKAMSSRPSETTGAAHEQQAEQAKAESEATAEQAKPLDTANVQNAMQYALVILQAVEGRKQEDATREVIISAQELEDSQGAPQDSEIVPDTALDGTNLACAANGLAYLLQNNPVDITLMETNRFDTSVISDRVKIQNRRNQLLQQYALSATIIAEGSNVISSRFYDRVSRLAEVAPTTTGTLGAMSVLNDSERYPYFEMIRQVTLSGVQLGLKGAVTLSHLDTLANENNDESDSGDDSDDDS